MTDDPHKTVARTSVAIVGGGPVGLALAYVLGRHGIDTILVEQRSATNVLLKGQYIGPSTAELFRQWGLMGRLLPESWDYDRYNGAGFYESLKSGLIFDARHSQRDEDGYAEEWERIVPQAPRGIPATAYEAALIDAVREWPSVRLRHGTRALDVRVSDEGATVLAQDVKSGELTSIEADYVVVASGKNHPFGKGIGLETRPGPDLGARILALFHAPLRDVMKDTPYYFFRITHPDARGLIQSEIPENGLWSYLYASNSPGDLSEEKILQRLRTAIGDKDFPIELQKVVRYRYDTGIAPQWRNGRAFLIGDAAHHHVPSGGFGVNIGIKDANNLGWKLALVVKGEASPRLLDTYQEEQKPILERIAKLATYTSGNLVALFDAMDTLEDPVFEGERNLSDASIDLLKQLYTQNDLYFVHGRHLLSATYRSDAIVDPPSDVPVMQMNGDYTERASPGSRAPHVWLLRNGVRRSIIDEFGNGFVLLAPHESEEWSAINSNALPTGAPSVTRMTIGGDEFMPADERWADVYGLASNQAVLVRPDGYIAARLTARSVSDAGQQLRQAIDLIVR